MNGRRQYGKLDAAIQRVRDELLAGEWSHSSTEMVMRQVVRLARLHETVFFKTSRETGDLHNFALIELVLEKLRTTRMSIALPPSDEHPKGQRILIRALHNVPTGKPLDAKRAAEPDAHARHGLWVRTLDLQLDEAGGIQESYQKRHKDAQSDTITIMAIATVLERHPARTRADQVWCEVIDEIQRAI